MALPEPHVGLVIRYAYLWRDEALRGREEGLKDRPCLIIHSRAMPGGEIEVFVAPITHAAPSRPGFGIAVPAATKARLGLDDEASWVVTTEVNRFVWPGSDLRRATAGGIAYGFLPAVMTKTVIDGIRNLARGRVVGRDSENPRR